MSPPDVNVPAPSVMVPAPAIEPTLVVRPFKSNVAPEDTVTAVDDDSAPAALDENFSVPAPTVVEPA